MNSFKPQFESLRDPEFEFESEPESELEFEPEGCQLEFEFDSFDWGLSDHAEKSWHVN